VLLDEQGHQLKSSYEEDLNPSDNQTVEKRSYAGCPRKCGEAQESFGGEADDFEDLGSSSLDDFDF
jgi:hypothetical protein